MDRPHHAERVGGRERGERQDAQPGHAGTLPGSLAAGPRPGLRRPRHQHRERRSDRPAPPTTVHYGEYETLVDDGAQLGRRLADFKVTSEVHSLPEGQHSFVLGAGRVPEVDQAIQQMGQWLRKHLGA
ncbi:alpha/beta hydrolase fold domain-containing protein [Streptomyces sp. NBC_00481]|nr:alpha/beta hydrolase fold domain-containing protein [Streptomyces sp. NBC_00481]